jgi:hypothetical protein
VLSKQRKKLADFDVAPLELAKLLRKTACFSVEPSVVPRLITPQALERTINGKDTTRSGARKRYAQGTAQRSATNSLVFWHVGDTRHD